MQRRAHPFGASLLLLAAFSLAACDFSGSDDSDVAQPGRFVTVAYEGRLEDGTVFDQSDRATFSLRRVVPGFREGVVGMRAGETNTFDVAPEDGYGDNPPEGIPPNATLTFEVELLAVR